MADNFEDKFMDLQAGLISLCLEVTDGKVDKVYAYASKEKKVLCLILFLKLMAKL